MACWSCAYCTYENDESMACCAMCNQQNAIPGEWTCDKCTLLNSKDCIKCSACHCDREFVDEVSQKAVEYERSRRIRRSLIHSDDTHEAKRAYGLNDVIEIDDDNDESVSHLGQSQNFFENVEEKEDDDELFDDTYNSADDEIYGGENENDDDNYDEVDDYNDKDDIDLRFRLGQHPVNLQSIEICPTYPEISSHFWSVADVRKSCATGIDFSKFTMKEPSISEQQAQYEKRRVARERKSVNKAKNKAGGAVTKRAKKRGGAGAGLQHQENGGGAKKASCGRGRKFYARKKA